MLFDLRGKRRRAVQATYLSLAVLMGLGLVGFGIGSDVSGGLADIFTGEDSVDESEATKQTQKRIDAANARLKTNPRDQAALITVIRGQFALASSDTDEKTGAYGEDGKKDLAGADVAWKKYIALKPEKVDLTMAQLMMQVYSPSALNKPNEATQAAEIVATERNDSTSYIQLLQFATLAGQDRKADLAADKALELAPEGEEKTVKQLIEQVKQQAKAPPEGGAPAPGSGGATPPVQPGG